MLCSEILRENTPRTLYHGTLRRNVSAIMHSGLSPTLGEFTKDAYDYDAEDDDLRNEYAHLVFAADKQGLDKAVSAIGSWIGIAYPDTPEPYGAAALERYGALCVIRHGEVRYGFEHHEDDDPPEWARQVEPEDYYTDRRITPDYILTGKKLINFLIRHGALGDERRLVKMSKLSQAAD